MCRSSVIRLYSDQARTIFLEDWSVGMMAEALAWTEIKIYIVKILYFELFLIVHNTYVLAHHIMTPFLLSVFLYQWYETQKIILNTLKCRKWLEEKKDYTNLGCLPFLADSLQFALRIPVGDMWSETWKQRK